MKLKQLFTDDDAVSPVIGVILMVAITVILAAVIGAFVLDLGSNQESTPQSTLTVETGDSADNITVVHDGGDTLNAGEFSVTADGNDVNASWPNADLGPGNSVGINVDDGTGGTVSEGDETTIRIVHDASGGVVVESDVTVAE